MSASPARDLDELQSVLGHRFADGALLERALVHASARGATGSPDNERLEFLGDAVLDLAISDLLMLRHPALAEGALSKMRAALVSEASLAGVASELGLGDWLVLGKGEESSEGRRKPRLLAGAYEAVLGAVYRDGGYAPCRELIARHFANAIETVEPGSDHKTALQELTQKLHKTTPRYEVVGVSGPDHDREYEVAVLVEDRELARGRGSSRKRAEQAAARQAADRAGRGGNT